MKKNIVLLILMIFSGTVFGQKDRVSTSSKKIHLGAKVGLNIAKVPEVLEEINENEARFGINAGLTSVYRVSDKIELQADILYSQQGTETEFLVKADGYQDFLIPTTLELSYLNVPVIFNYQIFNKAWIGIGPQIGFMLKDDGVIDEVIDVYDEQGNKNFSFGPFEGSVEEFFTYVGAIRNKNYEVDKKEIDFSIVFNGKYELFDDFFVEGRYQLGLTDIIQSPEIEVSPKNSVFSFGVIYNFL